ncbi:putative protein of unknown function (DUF1963) [Blattamonas nauphoetae]|uniref:DUF1963 domain-containing protein n=1 Tax=Blattamonas nauphoetae TaxID=2049346 RepID=A0ABQ9X3K5_9EUKA|nr:putative protein of unknown function (DUF1963) [Blattamonas nauphoetae]
MTSDDSKENLSKFYDRVKSTLIERTSEPVIMLEPNDKEPGIFDTKIGGIPYFPKNMSYPNSPSSNSPMALLCQLNFDTLPKLPGFPQNGMLQFFISDEELYGANFESPEKQDTWRVIYHPTIDPDPANQTTLNIPEVPQEAPFDKSFCFTAELRTEPIRYHDFRFQDILHELFADDAEAEGISFDEITDHLYDDGPPQCCRIGGYPTFTQDDPRYDTFASHTKLLLELETCKGMMWGDSGVANFFIRPDDLERLDFSNVVYSWDCC